MKSLFILIFGFISGVFCLTTLGSSSFIGVAILYSAILYGLFYAGRSASLNYLIGATIALELLGIQHFGLASALTIVAWVLHQIFADQLRFTSLYARYIVALLLMLTAYNLLFFSLAGFFHRLAILAVVAIVVTLVGLYKATTEPGPAYELI